MLKRILFTPVITIFAISLIFSLPFLKDNKIPLSTSFLVTWFSPWKYDYALPVKNGIPDIVSQIYPWKHFTIESIKKGELPLWNPYSFSGGPHLANFQSAVFSPINTLFSIFGQIDAWSIMILLQPLLAGIFMYLFARKNSISKFGSTITAISFMFGGFMTTWITYGTIGYALLVLPLILYGILLIIKENRLALGGALVAFSTAFSILSGHPQTSLYVIFASVLYAIVLAVCEKKTLKELPPPIMFILIGILLSGVQIIPSLELYNFSERGTKVSSDFFFNSLIPWHYLITLLSPDFFGSPVTRNNWFGSYAEWAGYAGIAPLILAISALNLRKKENLPFIFLGLTGLLMAVPSPISYLIYKLNLPFISTSPGGRAIVLLTFSIAFLSGKGYDQFMEKPSTVKKTIILLMLVTLLTFIGISAFGFQSTDIVAKTNILISQRNLIIPFMTLITLATSVFMFSKVTQKNQGRLIISCVILLIASVEMYRFAQKWTPFDPKEILYPRSDIIKFLQEKSKDNQRIFGVDGQEMSIVFNLFSTEGASPLNIKRYAGFLGSAKNGAPVQEDRTIAKIERDGKYTQRILQILGVRYFVYARDDRLESWVFPFWEYDYFPIYDELHYQVLENPDFVPRVMMVKNYEVEKDSQKIIDRILSDDFDIFNKIILEETPTGEDLDKGNARIESYSPNLVNIKTSSEKTSLLFLSDVYYPGWKVTIDGRPGKIYRADYTFRAVVTPPGEHLVKFIYDPESFKTGATVSLSSLVILTSILGLSKLKKRYERKS